MAISKEQTQQIVKKFQRKDLDTGSSEVQIALITYRIKDLAEHFKKHSKDHHGTQGLIKLVNRRRTLLDYLKRTDMKKYQTLIADLGIRK
ncbi:MAG: 30S ribosomal protein S15 [Bdellovibrionaceae bacterium]|nr:30S ribosomal protein S15 [Pseudobdellovibrionaceae bacterium]